MTGHVHAALMAEYAKDAAETERPWTRWQICHGDGTWVSVSGQPLWYGKSQYRRKPEPQYARICFDPRTKTVRAWVTCSGHDKLGLELTAIDRALQFLGDWVEIPSD